MKNVTLLLATLLSVGTCDAVDYYPKPVFACKLKAISAAERPRYNKLAKQIRRSIRNRREIANGYVFRLDSNIVTLPEAAEWIVMERLCCPFFTLQLSTSGNQQDWTFTLTGPKGVKQLIVSEFPAA